MTGAAVVLGIEWKVDYGRPVIFIVRRSKPFASPAIQMSPNPYQSPKACGEDARTRASRLRLHPFGLVICAIAAFCVYSVATKVPMGELQILRIPWLAVALISIAMFVLCFVFAQQCQRHKVRAELLYLLLPVGMFGYLVCRVVVTG